MVIICLVHTHHCMFVWQVIEDSTEDALLRSFVHYSSRPHFLHQCFYELFNRFKDCGQPRPDIVRVSKTVIWTFGTNITIVSVPFSRQRRLKVFTHCLQLTALWCCTAFGVNEPLASSFVSFFSYCSRREAVRISDTLHVRTAMAFM